jgi:outer membrane protein assembly factor BamC
MTVPEPAGSGPAPTAVGRVPAPAPEVRPAAKLQTAGDGVPTLRVAQPVDSVWPQIGQSLNDLGIQIERQDRQAGVYFIRYKDPQAEDESGFIKRLFTRNRTKSYQVKLAASGNDSIATIYDGRGRPDKTATSQRLLAMLSERFK